MIPAEAQFISKKPIFLFQRCMGGAGLQCVMVQSPASQVLGPIASFCSESRLNAAHGGT